MHLTLGKTESLERQIIIRVLILSSLVALLYAGLDYHTKPDKEALLFNIIVSCIYIAFFFIAKFSSYHAIKIPVLIFFLLSVVGGFLKMNGLMGVSMLDFLNLLFVIIFLCTGGQRVFFMTLYTIAVCFVVYIQLFQSQLIENTHANFPAYYLAVDLLTRIALTLNIAYAVKQEYDRERQITISKSEKITKVNEELEELIEQRTRSLQRQNEKLIHYAFFNAHKVRGPLATILGMINLLKIEKFNSAEEVRNYLEMLRESSEKLDTVIKEAGELLAEEEFMRDN